LGGEGGAAARIVTEMLAGAEEDVLDGAERMEALSLLARYVAEEERRAEGVSAGHAPGHEGGILWRHARMALRRLRETLGEARFSITKELLELVRFFEGGQ
jgi:hypothetical protein